MNNKKQDKLEVLKKARQKLKENYLKRLEERKKHETLTKINKTTIINFN